MNASIDQAHPKYKLQRALRPFSLAVSVVACLLGVSIAGHSNSLAPLNVVLVFIAGILLQAGVNLINDHADLRNPHISHRLSAIDIQHIHRNYHCGLGCFLLAAVLGIALAWLQDWWLLCLGAIGIAGALFYTAEPVNYKNRGLGVAVVFWMMGELMVMGSAWAVGAAPTLSILLQAIPVSLLTAALLLANELRDFEVDSAQQIQTLSVRIGFYKAAFIYQGLLAACVLMLLALWLANLQPWPLLPATTLLMAPQALRMLGLPPPLRQQLPPVTGRLLLAFGALQSLSFWLP